MSVWHADLRQVEEQPCAHSGYSEHTPRHFDLCFVLTSLSVSLAHEQGRSKHQHSDELQLSSMGLMSKATDYLKQILSPITMLLFTLDALQVHCERPLAKDTHTTDTQPQATTHYHHTLLRQRKHISCSSHCAGGTCHSSLVQAMANQILNLFRTAVFLTQHNENTNSTSQHSQ